VNSDKKPSENNVKKPISVNKINQIDDLKHIDENTAKYETPSFKNQQKTSFRAEKPVNSQKKAENTEESVKKLEISDKKLDNNDKSAEKLENHEENGIKLINTVEKPKMAINLLINSSEKGLKFIEKNRDFYNKQVDSLLNLKEIAAFSGQKIEIFSENDVFNIAEFNLPFEIPLKITKEIPIILEENSAKKPQFIEKSAEKSNRNHIMRPSVIKTLRFITEKPKINGKIVMDMQKNLGLGDIPAEVVFDKVMGEVHLSRTSKTYFKYKIEVFYLIFI